MSNGVSEDNGRWRSGRCLSECNLYLLDNEIASDVTFVVGKSKQNIKAHKTVLIARSHVFEQIICDSANNTPDSIEVLDAEPDSFKLFLRFLYTDEVSLQQNNIFEILMLAKRFAVCSLLEKTRVFIRSLLTVKNCCWLLEEAHKTQEKVLFDLALDMIKTEDDSILTSDDFTNLCRDCLDTVIKADDLDAMEYDIAIAVKQWADAECKRRGWELTLEKKRLALGQSLYYVRFPLLEENVFKKFISNEDFFSDKERETLLQSYSDPYADVKPFSKKPRLVKLVVERFSALGGHPGWNLDGVHDHAITFSCNHSVTLLGFQLHGPFSRIAATFNLSATLYDSHDVKVPGSTMTSSMDADETDETVNIFFPKHIHMEKHKRFTLVVTVTGGSTYYGTCGHSHVNADGCVWHFYDSNKSSGGTNVKHGLIPSLIFTKHK